RPHHASDTLSLQTFEPLSSTCLTCGKAARTRLLHPTHGDYPHRTASPALGSAPMYFSRLSTLSPALSAGIAEGAWALPHGEYELDVIALVGFLRYRRHQGLPEIHRSLHERGLTIGERTV